MRPRHSFAGLVLVGVVVAAWAMVALPGQATYGARVTADLDTLAHDPQTSGGLLAAVPPRLVDTLDRALEAASVEHWWIGRVESGDPAVALT